MRIGTIWSPGLLWPNLSQVLCVSGRRYFANCLLGSFLVAFPTPGFDAHPRLQQADEPVLVEAFIMQPAVERFDVGV